jgi:hypothetical protein
MGLIIDKCLDPEGDAHALSAPPRSDATMAHLTAPGATFGPIDQERWGRIATMTMPSGAQPPIRSCPVEQLPIDAAGQAGRAVKGHDPLIVSPS